MIEWPHYYILVNRLPVAVDVMTWARWWNANSEACQIGDDQIGNCRVSTVFIGVAMPNWAKLGIKSDPVTFETMIFGGPLDGHQWRYETYGEAERGHAEAVTAARIAIAKVKSIADTAGADR